MNKRLTWYLHGTLGLYKAQCWLLAPKQAKCHSQNCCVLCWGSTSEQRQVKSRETCLEVAHSMVVEAGTWVLNLDFLQACRLSWPTGLLTAFGFWVVFFLIWWEVLGWMQETVLMKFCLFIDLFVPKILAKWQFRTKNVSSKNLRWAQL